MPRHSGEDRLPQDPQKWVCTKCGSDKVEGLAWVPCNPDQQELPIPEHSFEADVTDELSNWCLDCDAHTIIELAGEEIEQL